MKQSWRIITGDTRRELANLPDCSVHCCVTSPPYWGLRDYGVDGQMGLEETPAEFIAGMAEVFREVRRVLRDDGTLWVNIGDSYAGSGRGGCVGGSSGLDGSVDGQDNARKARERMGRGSQLHAGLHESVRRGKGIGRAWVPAPEGLKQKDLVGIPWMLAFALRADGWYLRQDIIWAKPNPMPESIEDRCTKAHEYIFLFSKSRRYHYDAKAIAERSTGRDPGNVGHKHAEHAADLVERGDHSQRTKLGLLKMRKRAVPAGWDTSKGSHGTIHKHGARVRGNAEYNGEEAEIRNARSVWTIATQPRSVPHFAMFPDELPRRCIKAGCLVGGVVLDPFSGMATTGKVALELGRSYIGIELNPEWAEQSREALRQVSPLLATEAP